MRLKKELNHGITLIALIITIIVLLILAGIAIITLTGENGILNQASKAQEKTLQAQIKEEMEMTIIEIQTEELSNKKTVTLETLVNGQLANKLPNIIAELEDNKIIGEYKGYEYTIDDKFKVTIGEIIKGVTFHYTLDPIGYTNGDIKLYINATSTNGEITKIETTNNLTVNQDGSYTIQKNGNYEFTVTDSLGNTKTKNIKINQIDKVEPKNSSVKYEEITLDSFTINILAEDGDETKESVKSGIGKYELYIKSSTESEYIKYEFEDEKYMVQELKPNTNYNFYVIVYDKAGNYKQSENMTITTLNVPYPPITKLNFNESNATQKTLEYPILTLDGMKNCSLEPNIGEKVTLEITSTPPKDTIYYYSLDSGSTWNPYTNAITTNYNGENTIQVKSIYKDKVESTIKIVKKYIKDLNESCTASVALKNEGFDDKFDTYCEMAGSVGIEFKIDPECWGKYLSVYCCTPPTYYKYGVLQLLDINRNKILDGYLQDITGIEYTQLTTRSIFLPGEVDGAFCSTGTGSYSPRFHIYEVWCSSENLNGKQY